MTPKIRGPTRFFVVWKVSVIEMDLGNPNLAGILQSDILRNMEKARVLSRISFIEQIDFDYLEIQVIEEDDDY